MFCISTIYKSLFPSKLADYYFLFSLPVSVEEESSVTLHISKHSQQLWQVKLFEYLRENPQ